MELNEAIDRVKDLMEDCQEPPVYNRIELSDDGSEGIALEVVLTELDRLQKESISKDKILDKMVEVKLEFFNNSKDNDSFNFAYSNEYAHIEEVLRELLEEGNNEQV